MNVRKGSTPDVGKTMSTFLLIFGGLVWLVGGSIVLMRASKRQGKTWPQYPKWDETTSAERTTLLVLLFLAVGSYFASQLPAAN
jgi:hypothetical protein